MKSKSEHLKAKNLIEGMLVTNYEKVYKVSFDKEEIILENIKDDTDKRMFSKEQFNQNIWIEYKGDL